MREVGRKGEGRGRRPLGLESNGCCSREHIGEHTPHSSRLLRFELLGVRDGLQVGTDGAESGVDALEEAREDLLKSDVGGGDLHGHGRVHELLILEEEP